MSDHEAQLEQEREHLQEILDRDEFVQYREEQESLWEQVWQFVLDWLLGWIPEPVADSIFMEIIPYVLVFMSVGLLGLLMYWLSKQVIRRQYLSKQVALSEEELQLDVTDYLHKARQVRETHEWPAGVRYTLLALLMHWDDQGVLKVEVWKTNGEYARELQNGQNNRGALFREVALMFDRVWYGKETLSGQDYERLLQRVEEEVKAGEVNG